MSFQNQSSPVSWQRPRLLTLAEQQEYVSLMRLGAPPEVACQRVGVSPEDVVMTWHREPEFAQRLELIERHLARNVQSAIYKAAMGGSVYAQANYLRQCRPPKIERKPNASVDGLPSVERLRSLLLKQLQPPAEHGVDGTGI
jgi:hypothetical protein